MAIRRRNDLTVRDLGTELILYDSTAETFHILNDSARKIWMMLDGRHTADEIRTEYSRQYPREDPVRLGQDLVKTLDEFSRKGLVHTV